MQDLLLGLGVYFRTSRHLTFFSTETTCLPKLDKDLKVTFFLRKKLDFISTIFILHNIKRKKHGVNTRWDFVWTRVSKRIKVSVFSEKKSYAAHAPPQQQPYRSPGHCYYPERDKFSNEGTLFKIECNRAQFSAWALRLAVRRLWLWPIR